MYWFHRISLSFPGSGAPAAALYPLQMKTTLFFQIYLNLDGISITLIAANVEEILSAMTHFKLFLLCLW